MTPFVKDTIELTCKINVDRSTLKQIMDMAIDGSMHWVSQMAILSTAVKGTDITEAMLDGILIGVRDGITGHSYELSTGKFMTGMMNYLECATPPDGDFLEWVDHGLRIDLSYVTDQIADSILQYALFSEIRYRDGVRL